MDSDPTFNILNKGPRINWGRSPHREKMEKAISDWDKKEGDALDAKGNLLTSKAMYASKVGIPWTTLRAYVRPDLKKRRRLGLGFRGKTKILMTKDIDFIAEVCARADR